VLGIAGWEIALTGAGGAVAGALVGGLISFVGIVYAARRDRARREREELVDALAAWVFAADSIADLLETLPPKNPTPPWAGWVDKWLLGGDRGTYLFSRMVEDFLFRTFAEELRTMRARYYESNGRLGLLAPDELLDVARRITAFILEWQDDPGPTRLERWAPLRVEFTDTARRLLAAEAITRTNTTEAV
jgi:hypothetical protein